MLKQILFSLTLLLCLGSYAQCVPQDNVTEVLQLPEESYELTDTTTALPHAIVGQPYEVTCYMRIPTDTVIPYDLGTGVQDWEAALLTVGVNTIQGLPDGFTYDCATLDLDGVVTNNDCLVVGGGYGCLTLSSEEVPDVVGAYPLTVVLDVQAVVNFLGIDIEQTVQDDSMLAYLVLIVDEDNTDLAELVDARNFSFLGTYPNPSKNYFTIQYGNDKLADIDLKIYDILGNLVMSDNVNSTIGYNEFSVNASTLVSGIYTVCLSNDSDLFVKRIIIE